MKMHTILLPWLWGKRQPLAPQPPQPAPAPTPPPAPPQGELPLRVLQRAYEAQLLPYRQAASRLSAANFGEMKYELAGRIFEMGLLLKSLLPTAHNDITSEADLKNLEALLHPTDGEPTGNAILQDPTATPLEVLAVSDATKNFTNLRLLLNGYSLHCPAAPAAEPPASPEPDPGCNQ